MTCPARFDEGLGMWVVAEPREVRSVLRDPETYRPDNALTAHTPLSGRSLRILSTVGFALPPTLASNADPASHRPIRRAVSRFFTPARVAAAEPRTRELARDRIALAQKELLDGHSVDLVAAVAAEVPALVMSELLELEPVAMPDLKRWSRDSLELFWGWPDASRQQDLARSAADFYRWLRSCVEPARTTHRSGLFYALLALGLSDEEVCAAAYFLLIAGQETTTQLISSAFHHLAGSPALWNEVRDDPARATDVVERVLETSSSVPTWRRITAAETSVGEQRIPAGAPILLELTGHGGPADLAFGLGVHRCLGAALARMETRVAVEEIVTLGEIALVEPDPPMIDLLSFRAPARVLIAPR
jgi:cytochrome P450